MEWEPRKHLPLLVGVALIVAAIGLVVPWWTIDTGSSPRDVAPFSPSAGWGFLDDEAAMAVGVIDLFGLLGLAGGLALWIRGKDGDPDDLSTASWLWLAGGGFLLVAALTAVITWPDEDLAFWESVGSGSAFTVGTAASVGWYLTVLAGGVASISGLAWLAARAREQRAPREV